MLQIQILSHVLVTTQSQYPSFNMLCNLRYSTLAFLFTSPGVRVFAVDILLYILQLFVCSAVWKLVNNERMPFLFVVKCMHMS